jgi:hypothetical protein
MERNTSPSSEEILEKLEAIIETKEESGDVEEYKITILALTISHGEKIILRPQISDLSEFEDYERELKELPWYTFVEKTYIYGYAPFGNVCLISHNPNEIWSRPETKLGFQKTLNSLSIDTRNRSTFAKTVSQVNADFINRPVSRSETSQAKPRGAIMAQMFKTDKDLHSENMPIKGIMNPMTMRLEIIPSVYVLSGKNTDRIEEYLKEDPHTFMASQDRYSGIFVSVLSDNRDNTYEFPSLFNLADGKHIMEIYQRLQKPIPGIDVNSANGNELYQVVATYLEEWILYINSNKLPIILDITSIRNTYYIPDKLAERKKPVNYFMLTRLNTMNVYVLANLVFDFLLFKQTNPTIPYKKTKDELKLWIEELKTKNSKIINISTACESVNPYIMNEKIIQDVVPYINANSLHRTETQIETEEGGPDLIPFAELDNYIAQFEDKVEEEYEYEPLRESLKQPISDEFASPLKREIGGRKRRTIKMNRRKSNKRRRKSNKKKNK